MTKHNTNNVRSAFIDYFVKNDHTQVHSSPLIPHNDPSLMFVNSGMVQFKNVFTGLETRDYKRATSSQKSVRAGGKHNDLDNVGYTARHHTFFEMLGNFSFGDYFKEQSIYYAWDLLTKTFEIPKEKLYATVYHTDDEAIAFWKKISGFGDDKIIKINTNDNFWSMGDKGPCGPCSEIFYDHGDKIPGGLPGTPEQDGDRYIEIWNMVFMQFEQVDATTRIELPKKSIDTGMGLERVAAVLQGVHDNYDIDLFVDLISTSEELTKTKASGNSKFSHRVIADHLRSSAFLIADGVMPSNEGRGYVLRRIMRRAMRHAHILGAKDPLLYRMLPTLISLMGEAYPELKRAEDFISVILKQEEERFKTTLDKGLKLLEEESTSLTSGSTLSGEVAFKLYDTYGFPLDLTEDILKAKNIAINQKEFDQQMEQQRDRARKAWSGSGDAKTDNIWFKLQADHGATEFLGYSLNEAQATILELVHKSEQVNQIDTKGAEFILITNQTTFYGESGGQMGDIGTISSDNAKIKVVDTKKYLGNIHAHFCVLETGSVKTGDNVTLKIDIEHRNNLKSHHSATHILHAVLRDVLGKHVAQKGSLVSHDRFRFDISHPQSITLEQKALIEDRVNQIIFGNSEVKTVLMSTEEAIEQGAMALFGEKYDSEVRVVSMGIDDYSVELCGGTHVSRTGDIGAFKILSESAIAAGVRRIEAITGKYVIQYLRDNDNMLSNIADLLKSPRNEITEKLSNLLDIKKELEKELSRLKISSIGFTKETLEKEALTLSDNLRLVFQNIDNADPKIMRQAAEDASKLAEDIVAVFVSKSVEKISIIVAVSKPISSKHSAVAIAKNLATSSGIAGGGGSDTLAQAGGIGDMDLAKLQVIAQKWLEESK
jgi:alanyl-tRNA synthetase